VSVATAFIRRDLRIQRSYRLQFGIQLVSVLMTLCTYAFLARLLPGRQAALRDYDTDYFSFVLIGTGATTFFTVGLGAFSEALGREQSAGTLEALLVTPNDARWLLVAGSLWPVCFAALNLVVYIALGVVLFGGHLAGGNLLLVALMLVLSLSAFSALGLLAAATLIQVKRGSIVVGLTGAAFGLLGGVLYPITVLPSWIQVIAHLLPVTYGLDGVRQSLAAHVDVARVALDALALVGFIAALGPAALLVFQWSLGRARRDGSLSQY